MVEDGRQWLRCIVRGLDGSCSGGGGGNFVDPGTYGTVYTHVHTAK